MKAWIKILFIHLLVLFINESYAQNAFEDLLNKQTIQLSKKNAKLDTLNILLQNKVNIINAEKLKNPRDDNRITELLSSTASVTNSIDLIRIEIDQLSQKISSTKKELYVVYSNIIDSLKNLNSGDNSTDVEIIKVKEKRLLVSPKINILSFSPQSVLELRSPDNSVEQNIYNEYLQDALTEVETKIGKIELLKVEIKNILELNEETKDFLEDIDFDNNFAVYSNPNDSKATSNYLSYDPELGAGEEEARFNTVNTQSKSFSDILFQFGLYNNYNPSTELSSAGSLSNNNLRTFNILIETVEKQLSDYEAIINNKLKDN